MKQEEWQHYVNSEKFQRHFFKSMVEAIKNGKTLNSQHLAVYQSHGKIIEVLLALK